MTAVGSDRYTVADAVREWLEHGLTKTGESTRHTNRYLAETHIIPFLGARRLRALSAAEVDRWLANRAEVLSTSSVRKLHSALNRAVRRAMARDKVKRNVVDLCSIPQGRQGRPSKALTLAQGLLDPRRRRRDADARLRRRLAADRRQDGGAAGLAPGGRRPAGSAGSLSTRASIDGRLAVGAYYRGHQNSPLTPDPRPAGAVCRRPL